ncbi:hypothetical protein PENVUL_c059G03725 [Penicillium vulpinum]|uniref:Uncharacterized protein n=1 Tax=Penicillium vulpinum TaxID=29845 RepID=A0A1V6RET8_9EURO|nr:hypothetical protein PENVUL_c059G03725 [Penicillium vulpinum]
MASLTGHCWAYTPAANTVVAALGLILFALLLVVIYWRSRRGRRHTADFTITEGNMINIPTWTISYGLDVKQPYRRESYAFEDV